MPPNEASGALFSISILYIIINVSLPSLCDILSSTGHLVFHFFGALAQFERDLSRDRARAGLAAALLLPRQGVRPWNPLFTSGSARRVNPILAILVRHLCYPRLP